MSRGAAAEPRAGAAHACAIAAFSSAVRGRTMLKNFVFSLRMPSWCLILLSGESKEIVIGAE